MGVKIIQEQQAPAMKMKSSYVHEFPEFNEILEALATLPPGKAIEMKLSNESLAQLPRSRTADELELYTPHDYDLLDGGYVHRDDCAYCERLRRDERRLTDLERDSGCFEEEDS